MRSKRSWSANEVKGFELKNLAAQTYMTLSDYYSRRSRLGPIEFEVAERRLANAKRTAGGRRQSLRRSKNLEEYKGISIADIDPIRATVNFRNGDTLTAGEASGNVNESDIRRIQILDTINSHFDKE